MNQLSPFALLVAVAAPLLLPAGGLAQPPRERDARAAFAFAASFARQRAERPENFRDVTKVSDDGVRVWQSAGPTYFEGQPEPAPAYAPLVYTVPTYQPLPARYAAGGGRRGTVCVGGS